MSENEHPFEARKTQCLKQDDERVAPVDFWRMRHVARGDKVALEAAINQYGPVSIQMGPSSKLQFYRYIFPQGTLK